jgi:threonine dehydratase
MTVGDADVRRAMLAAFESLKLVLEPSGAVALAALLSGAVEVRDRSVLVYATGGNVSFADFQRHIAAL